MKRKKIIKLGRKIAPLICKVCGFIMGITANRKRKVCMHCTGEYKPL